MQDHPLERFMNRDYLPQWLLGGGVLLVILSAVVWWNGVYESPYNVYWGMLASSLATSSVTKHVTEKSSDSNLDQYIALTFGTENFAYGRTTLKSSTGTVKTESIGTLSNDYVRYTSIQSSQKNKTGQALNFSGVLGKWAQAKANNTTSQTSSAPFFIQSMLGIAGGNVVPIADLPPADRNNLLQLLHQSLVFNTSFTNVQKSSQVGRPVYTYTVAVEPVAYVAFQKAFAADLGIKTLQNVDPNNYQGESAINVKLAVDARSRHLISVTYQDANHTESYMSYGVPVKVQFPKATISDATLQALLEKVQ